MWKEHAKVIGAISAVVLTIYLIFFAHLATKPIAGHVVDIWRSPTMEHKKDLVGLQLKSLVKDELQMVEDAKTSIANSLLEDRIHEEVSDKDRKSLDAVINSSID